MYGKEYFEKQLSVKSNPIRRFIRGFYLRSLKRMTSGNIIDFGCGLGSLLELFDTGSSGVEANKYDVDYCMQSGLDVFQLDDDFDPTTLAIPPDRSYTTLVLNHVLEHIPDPDSYFKRLIDWSSTFGVEKIVVVVPGLAGFKSDPTHIQFITIDFLSEFCTRNNYSLEMSCFYPLNHEKAGNYFVHNELRALISI